MPERSQQQEPGAAARAPVAYLVFNRPRHTATTFEAIRAYRPERLLVVADGPRKGRPGDEADCHEVRRIVSDVDWPCEVEHDYSAVNLGCGRRVSSGLDWVFSRVDRAIVVEDDCLASPAFFSFCERMLQHYAGNEAVWVVNGNSYQPHVRRGDGSYYFSKYPDTWGWATWRRAWANFRYDLPFLEAWRNSPLWRRRFPVGSEGRYFERLFRESAAGRIDTWDYQWTACVIHGGGLCATPNANLVRNIGFDEAGTHTDAAAADRLAYEITDAGAFAHPSSIRADAAADDHYRRHFGFHRSLARALLDRMQDVLSRRRGGAP